MEKCEYDADDGELCPMDISEEGEEYINKRSPIYEELPLPPQPPDIFFESFHDDEDRDGDYDIIDPPEKIRQRRFVFAKRRGNNSQQNGKIISSYNFPSNNSNQTNFNIESSLLKQ